MLFDDKSVQDILKSLESESAKTLSELHCAQEDIKQAQARLKFLLAAVHYLKERI